MNKNSFILSISFSVIVLSVYSQTAIWQIKPTDYDKIERLGRTLYIVQKNNKIGIVNEQGTILAPPENDNLGMFYEHKALITLQDSKGERIIGVLSDDETFHKFSNKFYTLNGQKFYSDGVLSVSDENGKVGYIDDKGNQILGFDGKYTKIKPFCEGYASVFKNKKYYLITLDGEDFQKPLNKKNISLSSRTTLSFRMICYHSARKCWNATSMTNASAEYAE